MTNRTASRYLILKGAMSSILVLLWGMVVGQAYLQEFSGPEEEGSSEKIAEVRIGPDAAALVESSNTVTANFTWSATGGTITANGVYRAGSAPGTYEVLAAEESGLADTATVTVLQSTGSNEVALYGVWETEVTNTKTYSNPFDYTVIELQATFTSPTGRTVSFFGFYDGDGHGGQTGSIWKLRFMPDEVGTWSYTHAWTDGTAGDAGEFDVVDTGLPGPLRVATDNTWWFEDSRGNPFHWRGYDIHNYSRYTSSRSIELEIENFLADVQARIIDRGYNFTMVDGLHDRLNQSSNSWEEAWWENTTDTDRFNVSAWGAYEQLLNALRDAGVYVIMFSGMTRQRAEYDTQDMEVFLRYWVARFAPYYNFMGWSPTWEWTDVYNSAQINTIGGFLHDNDPWKRLLSAHDCSHSSFAGWLGFSMRQSQSRDVFDGNGRQTGQQQGSCDGAGGIGSAFVNQPIIGSEDIWETESGANGQPRTATEVRRAAWGIMMAGVMPLYSEWHPSPPPTGGEGTAEPLIRRMFDFLYSRTRYREYEQLNTLVSKGDRQICSGISGTEYLVYDEDGGSISIDLSGVPPSTAFSVLWFDPTTGSEHAAGTIAGGAQRSLTAPFSCDSVLLLRLE